MLFRSACLEAAHMAWEYRARFKLDFLIDIVGYRRFGHNEGDEPAFTQPLLYQKVGKHETVRQKWARIQTESGNIAAEVPDQLIKKHFAILEKAFDSLKPEEDYVAPMPEPVPAGMAARAKTGVSLEALHAINDELLMRPEGFAFHKKLERGREKRRHALDNPKERTIDWATAEELAFATILEIGRAHV